MQELARSRHLPGLTKYTCKNGFLGYSKGWLNNFKSRFKIKQYQIYGESGSVSQELVEIARKECREFIKKWLGLGNGRSIKDVFNLDETALFYKLLPNRTLANSAVEGMKVNKERITIAIISNADGSEKIKPIVIGIELFLNSNQIKMLNGLEEMFNLKYLELDSNQIHTLIKLENMTQLNFLSLGMNRVEYLEEIQKLTMLTYLYLGINNIKTLKGLENLMNLKTNSNRKICILQFEETFIDY